MSSILRTCDSIVDMHPDERAHEVCIDINQKLSKLSLETSKCSIYRTHDHLRNVNAKAYEPEIIAIGPYHRDKDNTKMMEKHKFLYLQGLLKDENQNVEKYFSAIGKMEQEARKCYAEPIGLTPAEFTEMMVLDGCFIIALLRNCNMGYLGDENDPIFTTNWMLNSLVRDLMLFENQIPFSVLCKLFDLIEHPNHHERLIYLVLRFFRRVFPGAGNRISTVDKNSDEIKHLLELIHISQRPSVDWLNSNKDTKDETRRRRFISYATKLRDAIVMFGRNERANKDTEDGKVFLQFISSATKLRDANVKFEINKDALSLFHVTFKNGSMLLPTLTVEDTTESFFRNLIAYEQYFPDTECNFVTDYMTLFDCLVDSPGDVEILRKHGILVNWLGDEERVSNMFNKLGDSVMISGEQCIYAKIFESVNIHCNKRRNKWMANLRENYFNSPWTIISVLVAVVLLLLTVIQTVCSILQVI